MVDKLIIKPPFIQRIKHIYILDFLKDLFQWKQFTAIFFAEFKISRDVGSAEGACESQNSLHLKTNIGGRSWVPPPLNTPQENRNQGSFTLSKFTVLIIRNYNDSLVTL